MSLYVSPIHVVIMFSVIRGLVIPVCITMWQFVDQFGLRWNEIPADWADRNHMMLGDSRLHNIFSF